MMISDNETVERPRRNDSRTYLPLDARPRRAHEERLVAWGLPGGVPRFGLKKTFIGS